MEISVLLFYSQRVELPTKLRKFQPQRQTFDGLLLKLFLAYLSLAPNKEYPSSIFCEKLRKHSPAWIELKAFIYATVVKHLSSAFSGNGLSLQRYFLGFPNS